LRLQRIEEVVHLLVGEPLEEVLHLLRTAEALGAGGEETGVTVAREVLPLDLVIGAVALLPRRGSELRERAGLRATTKPAGGRGAPARRRGLREYRDNVRGPNAPVDLLLTDALVAEDIGAAVPDAAASPRRARKGFLVDAPNAVGLHPPPLGQDRRRDEGIRIDPAHQSH